jgi:hypothetical protein
LWSKRRRIPQKTWEAEMASLGFSGPVIPKCEWVQHFQHREKQQHSLYWCFPEAQCAQPKYCFLSHNGVLLEYPFFYEMMVMVNGGEFVYLKLTK